MSAAVCKASQITGQRNWGYQNQRRKISITGERCSERRWKPWTSKKEKTDNQICKWLKDPESDSAKYKMWGNGIALPCAMFVMEGIAMILSEEDADEQK